MAPSVLTIFAPQPTTTEDSAGSPPSLDDRTTPFPPYCEPPEEEGEGDDGRDRDEASGRPDSAFAFFSSPRVAPSHAPIFDDGDDDDHDDDDGNSHYQSPTFLPTELASSSSSPNPTNPPPQPQPQPLALYPPSEPQAQPPPPYWTHASSNNNNNNMLAALLSPSTVSASSCSSPALSALSPRSLLSPLSPPSSHGSDAHPLSPPTPSLPWPPPSSASSKTPAAGSSRLASLHQRDTSVSSVRANLITLQDNEADGDLPGPFALSTAPSIAAALLPSSSSACWARRVDVTDYVIVGGNGIIGGSSGSGGGGGGGSSSRSSSKRLKNAFFHSRPSLSSFSASATAPSPAAALPSLHAFVVWTIRVQTLHGGSTAPLLIYKRYSEFDGLRRRLLLSFPTCAAAVPPLPPKSMLHNFQPRFLEQRRLGLQYFLNCVLLNPEFAGSPVVKEFLFPS